MGANKNLNKEHSTKLKHLKGGIRGLSNQQVSVLKTLFPNHKVTWKPAPFPPGNGGTWVLNDTTVIDTKTIRIEYSSTGLVCSEPVKLVVSNHDANDELVSILEPRFFDVVKQNLVARLMDDFSPYDHSAGLMDLVPIENLIEHLKFTLI